MQHKLENGPLLDDKGNLCEAGYAFSLVKEYDRSKIKANSMRIKEWDYYYIGNEEYGIALTIADNSYMWLCTASFLDFKSKTEITKSKMGALSRGKIGFPSTSEEGDVEKIGKDFDFRFFNDGEKRHLFVTYDNFDGDKTFSCDVRLEQTMKDTMVIATPWPKDKHFYYNQKINCLKATGSFKIGDSAYSLDDSYGVLDWGRGVWTYKNTWYWSSLSGVDPDGVNVGFNLGYGFGDTSAASENMVFYGDKAYKLEDVKFNIPQTEDGKDSFLENWTFKSESGDIDLVFEPILDRYTNTDVLVIKTLQHQVFGKFYGTIKAEDKEIKIDGITGFAEKVYMKY